jgi:hypothetical protein
VKQLGNRAADAGCSPGDHDVTIAEPLVRGSNIAFFHRISYSSAVSIL